MFVKLQKTHLKHFPMPFGAGGFPSGTQVPSEGRLDEANANRPLLQRKSDLVLSSQPADSPIEERRFCFRTPFKLGKAEFTVSVQNLPDGPSCCPNFFFHATSLLKANAVNLFSFL